MVAALLISLVPPLDIRTRSSLSTLFLVIWLSSIVFIGFKGLLDKIHLGLLLTQIIILFGVRFHRKSPALLPPMSWLLATLSTAAILTTHAHIFLFLAYLQVAFLMFVVSQTGGLYKGSSCYETFLFFIAIDLSAFFALSLPYSWTYWVLILPGLARLIFPFTAPFARNLFVTCPTEIMLLILGGLVPVGIAWLLLLPLSCPDPNFLETVCFSASFFAAILFLIEKSRRQRAIYLFMIQSALCFLVLPQLGSILCLAALLNTALWLYFIEYPAIRYLNMATAAITLFLLVYKP
jgi:hypothetical protein